RLLVERKRLQRSLGELERATRDLLRSRRLGCGTAREPKRFESGVGRYGDARSAVQSRFLEEGGCELETRRPALGGGGRVQNRRSPRSQSRSAFASFKSGFGKDRAACGGERWLVAGEPYFAERVAGASESEERSRLAEPSVVGDDVAGRRRLLVRSKRLVHAVRTLEQEPGEVAEARCVQRGGRRARQTFGDE